MPWEPSVHGKKSIDLYCTVAYPAKVSLPEIVLVLNPASSLASPTRVGATTLFSLAVDLLGRSPPPKTYSSLCSPSPFLAACTTHRYVAASTASTTSAFRQHQPTTATNMPSPRPILHRDVVSTIPATARFPTPAACTCLPAPCASQFSAYSTCIHKS